MPYTPAISGTTTGYKAQGVTTIRWTTFGQVSSIGGVAVASFAVVLRITQKPLVENQRLPAGVGVSTTRVQITDGVQWNITIRDDTRFTAPPRPGTQIVVADLAGYIGTPGAYYVATIEEPEYDTGVKQAGEHTIMATNLVAIESQTAS